VGTHRSTPKGLVRLLPTLSAFGYIHLGNWHEFRSQVLLIGPIPDTTSPDHTEFHDALSTRNRPRHPRAFEPLRKDNFTGHLRWSRCRWAKADVCRTESASNDCACADTQRLAYRSWPSPPDRDGAAKPTTTVRPALPLPIGPCFPLLLHPLGPMLTFGSKTKDDVRQPLHVLAHMIIIDHPYPLQVAPRTAQVWHLLEHAMEIIARVIAFIGHRDQGQPLAIDLAQDVVEQGASWRGQDLLTGSGM